MPFTDGHPALSSPSLPANAKADQADASPNPATTEWRRSRPHEDWVLSHPVYTQEELDSIQIVERPPEGTSDKIAMWLVKTSRAGFDFVTGYRHADPEAAREAARKAGKENLVRCLAVVRQNAKLRTTESDGLVPSAVSRRASKRRVLDDGEAMDGEDCAFSGVQDLRREIAELTIPFSS